MLLLLVAVVGVVANEVKIKQNREVEVGDIPFLAPEDVMNPEIAKKYDISGYIEITSANSSILKGNTTVTYYLHFVSHDPNVKETKVKIDPKGDGLAITQVYLDEKGERKEFTLNDFVHYEPQGVITIKDGETKAVKMTIRIPKLKASYIPEFPVGPIGISAGVPIIDRTQNYATLG